MSQTIFLSSVSNEFGLFRRRLANLGQRTKKCHFRHQDDFFHRGVKTLQKLVEEIEQSTVVLHIIGDQAGWSVPTDQANALLEQRPEFEKRFPEVAAQARRGELPATQWEAWLGLLLDKRLLAFQLQSPERDLLQQTHIQRLNALAEHPQVAEDIESLYDEMVGSLITLGIFTPADVQRPNNLPYRSLGELFIGRDEFMSDLQRRLYMSATGVAAITTRPQTLFGAGGVGKTRTAIEYAWRNTDQYTALLFLSAVSPAALTTSLANLVGVLGISGLDTATDDVRFQASLDWLHAHPGWLAILDNVDDDEAAQAVKVQLAAMGNGHVLITSRLATWSGSVEKLELELLTPEAARDYLLQATDQRTPRDDDVEQATAVGQKVGLLALGLEHATAYINAGGLTFAEYSQRWNDDEASILGEFDLSQIDYPRELLVTWRMSVERVDSVARSLLEILSWLAPDPIAESTMDLLAKFGVSKPRSALNALVKFSLIKRESKDGLRHYTQHRLVQATTRYHQRSAQELCDAKLPHLESAIAWMDAAFRGQPQDVRDWPKLEPLSTHVLAVCQFAERDKKTTSKHPTSRLFRDIGSLLFAKARHREAESPLRCALAIDEERVDQLSQLLPVSESEIMAASSSVAIDLNDLGQLLKATNRLAEAEPLMRRALSIDEKIYGSEHPEVAIDLNNLASLLQATNRMSEAEPLMRRALAIDERTFGTEHPNVAIDLNNLASLLQATNHLSEAEPLMRRALAIDEQSFGPKHPNVAIHLNNLAQLLKATNRLSEAEPLMRRALAIDEQSYGTEHPDLAIDLSNLAQLLQATNRLSEAEPLMRRALAIDEQSYGAEHPNVALDLNNLAQLLKATGHLPEAEPLMRRALAIDEKSFGTEHPKVAIRLNNLAQLLKATDRLPEAEPLMRRALAIDEESYGREHPKVAIRLNNLASLLHATKRLSEAEPLSWLAIEILLDFRKTTGHEHPQMQTVITNCQRLLEASGLSEALANKKIQSKLRGET